ncbi:MAG TPA: serine hydrolase domain-containing protein [Gammaproteobacteria bacterium]|nr:serine hydrolase domain-containing protein [Gammaproteobacteria bacterium]
MRQPAGSLYLIGGIFLCLFAPAVLGAPPPAAEAIGSYLKPFADTNNFSGTVLVTEKGQTLFEKSYGFADLAGRVQNGADTRFHVASVSMLFTAFATMRLVEQGKLSLDDTAGSIIGPLPNGDRITVRELLEDNSGIPDAEELPGYDALLEAHQTPGSLIQQIRGLKPLAEPGGKYKDEERSAYQALALIIEKKTGLPFAQAMQKLVFGPAGMKDSGVDDDSPIGGHVALGYRPEGEFGLKRAHVIHWSAKPGNGSDYSTADDINRWFSELLGDKLLSAKSRAMIMASDKDGGFGWEKGADRRFGEDSYFSNGRAPGFSSVMYNLPKEGVTVIIVGNIEHDMNPEVAGNILALVVGKPYTAFAYQPFPLTPDQRQRFTGQFKFGADFYRPGATLEIKDSPQGLMLEWPGGPEAPLLPIGADRFMDRYYWTPATIVRDAAGRPAELKYGKFQGTAVSPP